MSQFSSQRDRGAYEAEWKALLSPAQAAAAGALSDPLRASAASRDAIGGPGQAPVIAEGRIVGACAGTHGYRVIFGNGSPPRICTPLVQTSLGPVGMRQLNTYVPDTLVWVLLSRERECGLILGAVPSTVLSPSGALPDMITQASACGVAVDQAHTALMELDGGYPDQSSGRPSDSLPVGEYGAIAETGLRFFGDSHMVHMAIDEFTGVFAFYDQTLKVGGRHMQVDTCGSSRETLEDQGEVYHYSGSSPYTWENLGLYAPGDPARAVDDVDHQFATPYYSALEPLEDRQAPFHRLVTLGGYLGHGTTSYVLLPPAADGVHTVGGEAPIAVASDHTALTGARAIRSAKMMVVGKYGAIPGPRRLRRPEDAGGDNPSNYRAAGVGEEGDAHDVSDTVGATHEDAAGQRLAAIDDVLAHAFNYESVLPLHAHKRDWELPQEGETRLGAAASVPDFASLASEPSLPAPEPLRVRVDHRYEEGTYYPNNSLQVFTEDGQILIVDGFGSEILMGGGSVRISCPGDIILAPGRSLVGLAGKDAILRAKGSVDLSATEHDVRLKARRNVQVVGGVGGTGGVLIESRGAAAYGYAETGEDADVGGVHIKSASDVAVWGADLYLRSTSGGVTVDAAAGDAAVVVNADSVRRYVRTSAVDAFGNPEAPDAVNSWGADNVVAGTFGAGGAATLGGTLLVAGGISSVSGHVATTRGGQLDPLSGTTLNEAARRVEQQGDAIEEAGPAGAEAYAADVAARWHAEGSAGHADTISRAGFSFRKAGQYLTTKWRMWEARWQRMARLAGTIPATWTEQPVAAGTDPTYPYPGRAWADGDGYLQQDLTLFDAARGVSKDRSDPAYVGPKLAPATPTKPDGNYIVTA